MIILSTIENPVDKSYIDSKLGRDGAFDENQEIVRGEVVVIKEGCEEKLSGVYWLYDEVNERFKKENF